MGSGRNKQEEGLSPVCINNEIRGKKTPCFCATARGSNPTPDAIYTCCYLAQHQETEMVMCNTDVCNVHGELHYCFSQNMVGNM